MRMRPLLRYSARRMAAALLLALAAGCAPAPEPPEIALTPVPYDALPGWQSGDQAGALIPLERSCARWFRRPADAPAGGAVAGLTASDFRAPCRALAAVTGNGDAARDVIERHFRPYAVVGAGGPEGLFTGYFEPEFPAARRQTAGFGVPVHGLPGDLVTVRLGDFDPALKGERIVGRVEKGRLVPYPDRARIAAGGLAKGVPVLLWAADPVDVFFLQIQGSGRARLPDGSIVRLGFAGHNGRPYTAIGRVLVDRGALDRDEVSMQSIARWLRANPAAAPDVMNRNARYVFFRELTGPGPLGAEGVALTPGRSLAVDRGLIPLGIPLWLDTADALDAARPFRRLMVAQDTGGAIKGAVRGDIFFGAGADAATRAGRMNRRGRYFLLLPRDFAPGT